jgi:hypothetical protein
MAGRWLVAVVGAVEIGCSINFIPVSTTVCIYLRLVGAFICNFRNLDFLGKRVGFSLGGGLLTAKNPLPEGLC